MAVPPNLPTNLVLCMSFCLAVYFLSLLEGAIHFLDPSEEVTDANQRSGIRTRFIISTNRTGDSVFVSAVTMSSPLSSEDLSRVSATFLVILDSRLVSDRATVTFRWGSASFTTQADLSRDEENYICESAGKRNGWRPKGRCNYER